MERLRVTEYFWQARMSLHIFQMSLYVFRRDSTQQAWKSLAAKNVAPVTRNKRNIYKRTNQINYNNNNNSKKQKQKLK